LNDITLAINFFYFWYWYGSYKVISESNHTGYRPGVVAVDRRYSDFDWLQNEFSYEFPGCILPPLPDKNAMNRISPEFVETRRRALDRYLSRVVLHPELSDSILLAVFLQGDDAALARAKEEAKQNKPKLASSAVSWLEGTVISLASGKPELEKSAADVRVEETSQYVSKLEKQLTGVVKHVDGMVRRLKETSTNLFEFGQSLNFLGQSEGDAVGTALAHMGETIESIASCYTSQAEEEISKFMEPLEDYTRMMYSVKTAIQQRQDKRNAYIAALADVEAKAAAWKKVQGVMGKESMARQKEEIAVLAEEQRDRAKQEYERVTDRLLGEFESFRQRKAIDIKEIVSNFVDLQIEHDRRMEAIWADVIPKLQSIPLPSGATFEDITASVGGDGTANASNQSNFHEEDDEDYSGV
jgi:sorting nexin-1/2